MIEILVVAEADADRSMACGLADRVVMQSAPEWWDREEGTRSEHLNSARRWIGLESGSAFTSWRDLKRVAESTRLPKRLPRFLGHSGTGNTGFDYASGEKALLLADALVPSAEERHVLLVRDLDNQPEPRRRSLEHLRERFSRKFSITLALPEPNREAWLLAGFVAKSAGETEAHAEVRRELGFDPCQHSHRLSADMGNAPKSAKKVFSQLLKMGDTADRSAERRAREEDCWSQPGLGHLRDRGNRNGLSAYLNEAERQLAPAIRGQ
jgi:hypothetical protein